MCQRTRATDSRSHSALSEHNLHHYHIADRPGPDADKKVSFPYVKHGDNGYGYRLRRKGRERCDLDGFEAINDEYGDDRRRKDLPDIRDHRVGALFSTEQGKREKPCQKGTDGNGEDYTCII